ncbi:hypothetical protein BH23BAC1_BH23BAC1_12500 [soil metagenome]
MVKIPEITEGIGSEVTILIKNLRINMIGQFIEYLPGRIIYSTLKLFKMIKIF